MERDMVFNQKASTEDATSGNGSPNGRIPSNESNLFKPPAGPSRGKRRVSINTKFNPGSKIRVNGKRQPRFSLINSEGVKIDIYRDWVGRRGGVDWGNDNDKERAQKAGRHMVAYDKATLKEFKSIAEQTGLTFEQVRAFREVFDLFDSNGGGTIDAEELDLTLRTVDIVLKENEITKILQNIDKDGNGEIDFREFLQIMTSTERFIETLTSDEPEAGSAEVKNENLLFSALTEFMKKSALKSINEIVGYFHTKYKKFKVPHVMNHYAAGARLIGLTDKELKKHIEKIKADNASDPRLQKSPYADPILYVHSLSNSTPKFSRQRQCRSDSPGKICLNLKGFPADDSKPCSCSCSHSKADAHSRGVSRASMKSSKLPSINGSQMQCSQMQCSQMQCRSHSTATSRSGPGSGWISQRIEHSEFKLPAAPLKDLPPFDQLTAEDLPAIRSQVRSACEKYEHKRRQSQLKKNYEHWRHLDTDTISPGILQNHFQQVFSHYSKLQQGMLRRRVSCASRMKSSSRGASQLSEKHELC